MLLQGTQAPPPSRRSAKASDTRGAYGGVAAHEATKLRNREAQQKVRQRQKQKVRHVNGILSERLAGSKKLTFIGQW